MKTYETAPVHPDFAPPARGLWEWVAILEMPSNDIVAMAANPARALQIITALQAQEARQERQQPEQRSELRRSASDWREW